MLTVPITTPFFNLRVLNLIIEYIARRGSDAGTLAVPTVPPLSALDTNLAPGEKVTQMLGVVSPWIDLCSPDAVIYNISRQILEMEVAYAAFCGIGNLILPCPKLHHGKNHATGVAQYAHAVKKALEVGSFIHLSVTLPMMDNPHDVVEETQGSLALYARPEYVGVMDNESDYIQDANAPLLTAPEELLKIRPRKSVHVSSKHDYFGTWDAWNVIRTICRYSSRLFVGKNIKISIPHIHTLSRSLFHLLCSLKSILKDHWLCGRDIFPVCFPPLPHLEVARCISNQLIVTDSSDDTSLPSSCLGLL